MHGHRLVCGHCGDEFFICASCYRCHRYCSSHCQSQGYKSCRKKANRKHAISIEGKLDNRDRNREYRKRKDSGLISVTDKSSVEGRVPLTSATKQHRRCIKCRIKVSVYKEAQWEEMTILNGLHGTQ